MKIVSQAKGRLPIVNGQHRWIRESDGSLAINFDSIPNLRMSFSSVQDLEAYWDSLYKLYENEKDDVTDANE
jgi:hypothetical protein